MLLSVVSMSSYVYSYIFRDTYIYIFFNTSLGKRLEVYNIDIQSDRVNIAIKLAILFKIGYGNVSYEIIACKYLLLLS